MVIVACAVRDCSTVPEQHQGLPTCSGSTARRFRRPCGGSLAMVLSDIRKRAWIWVRAWATAAVGPTAADRAWAGISMSGGKRHRSTECALTKRRAHPEQSYIAVYHTLWQLLRLDSAPPEHADQVQWPIAEHAAGRSNVPRRRDGRSSRRGSGGCQVRPVGWVEHGGREGFGRRCALCTAYQAFLVGIPGQR